LWCGDKDCGEKKKRENEQWGDNSTFFGIPLSTHRVFGKEKSWIFVFSYDTSMGGKEEDITK
jgi:hypothetical protein